MPPDAEDPLHPDDLVGARLRTSLRGFDQLEVRALLNRAADRVRQLEGMVERLRGDLEDAETRTAAVADLDEDALTLALGSETARVLRSAKDAAVEIRRTAEVKAAEILRAAEARSQALMAEAEGLYERETVRANEAAEDILNKAKSAGRSELERGRAEGRRLVAEARTLRTRLLEDLAQRRQGALAELQRMTAARRRLLETYAVVEETLSRATGALEQAEDDVEIRTEAVDVGLPADLAAELAELESSPAAEPVDTRLQPEPSATHPDDEEGDHVTESAEDDANRRPHLRIDDLAAGRLAEESPSASPAARRDPEGPAEGDGGDGDDEEDPEGGPGRRTSALRVLRKPPAAPLPESEVVAPPGFTLVDHDATEEGVRVIAGPATGGEGHEEQEPEEDGPEEPRDQGLREELEEDPEGEPVVGEAADVEDLFDRIKAEREERSSEPEPADPGERQAQDAAPLDDESRIFAERDAAVDAGLPAVVRAFKRTLGDEQNEVLAAVSDSRGVPRADQVLAPETEQRTAYAEPIARTLAAVAQAGAAAAGGGEPDVTGLAGSVAASLCDPLRARIAGVLDDTDSDTHDLELAERVSAVYRQWRRQRLDRIADEALRAAFALGIQSAASAAGAELQWTLDPRQETCSPDCEDNALAGPVAAGQPFPAGGVSPPGHSECRCLALPIGTPED